MRSHDRGSFYVAMLLATVACAAVTLAVGITACKPRSLEPESAVRQMSGSDDLYAALDEANRELYKAMGSLAAEPGTEAANELDAVSESLNTKTAAAVAKFEQASPTLISQLEAKVESMTPSAAALGTDSGSTEIALTTENRLLVAGQWLSGKALQGHLAVRYGTGGMLTRPGLVDDKLLLYIANKIWPANVRQGQTFTSTEDPELWRIFSERYGFTPDTEVNNRPYGITRASYKMREVFFVNCYACHIGTIRNAKGEDEPWLGAPNQKINFGLIFSDIAQASARRIFTLHVPDSQAATYTYFLMDPIPKGQSLAVFFGWFLAKSRTPEMYFRPTNLLAGKSLKDVLRGKEILPLSEQFIPANVPPWWWSRGPYLYSDASAKRLAHYGNFGLAQMYLSPANTSEFLNSPQFVEGMSSISALVEAVKPPTYAGTVNKNLAAKGEVLFNHNCASCHNNAQRHNVGTDPVLAQSFADFGQLFVNLSWFEGLEPRSTFLNPSEDSSSYRAPPLTAVWTRSLGFHNASIPLHWVFKATKVLPDAFIEVVDQHDPSSTRSMGIGPLVAWRNLSANGMSSSPLGIRERMLEKINYINPSRRGSSMEGHLFAHLKSEGGRLSTEDDQKAIIEYLKVRCSKGTIMKPTYGTCLEGVKTAAP